MIRICLLFAFLFSQKFWNAFHEMWRSIIRQDVSVFQLSSPFRSPKQLIGKTSYKDNPTVSRVLLIVDHSTGANHMCSSLLKKNVFWYINADLYSWARKVVKRDERVRLKNQRCKLFFRRRSGDNRGVEIRCIGMSGTFIQKFNSSFKSFARNTSKR